MSVLAEVRSRFMRVLSRFPGDTDKLLELIRPSQDTRFGDYQVNCAMPLQKVVGRPPREIAAELLSDAQLDGLAEAEIAGPGFINLRLKESWISDRLQKALADARLGVPAVTHPRTYVIDFSSPNVAKPMHVGHIRSTVIGDALSRILRFVGHRVVTDNHLGDWGTQFGMIIYGFRHFVNRAAYDANPIDELGRLYRLVRQLSDYQSAVTELPAAEQQLQRLDAALQRVETEGVAHAGKPTDKNVAKKRAKDIQAIQQKIEEQTETIASLKSKIAAVKADVALSASAVEHPNIEQRVQEETAKLHEGDPDNTRLWHEFLPHCRADIRAIYDRLNVTFDHELGESFYHDQLAEVVESFLQRDLRGRATVRSAFFLAGSMRR